MIRPGKIIVIGGNAAGPAAAAKAKRINPSAKVILFEKGNYISTGTCEIPYVLSGEIKSYEDIIFNSAESFLNNKGVHVFINHYVERINRRLKTISVRDNFSGKINEHSYDTLVLATGSSPVALPEFSNRIENVFYLKNVQNLIEIKQFLEQNDVSKAAIIGSGFIGLETAEALKNLGLNITIIERESFPLPGAEDEISSRIFDELKMQSIQLIANNKRIEPFIKNERVISLKCDTNQLNTDMVIIAAGVSPDVNLAVNSKIDIGSFRGIKVDRKLRTSDRNIFAAGDNIEVKNFISGKPDYLPFATYAHTFGHIAGENAAGGNVNVEPVIKNVSLKFFDNYIATVGLNSNYSFDPRFKIRSTTAEIPNLVSVMPSSRKVFGKLVYDSEDKKILGASFFGGIEISGYADLVASAIYSGQKINFLTKINYNYTPPLSPFVNLLSVLGRKAVDSLKI